MPTISKLQRRDLEALEELHPDYDFEVAYLEHLQELRHILVANQKDDEGIRSYFGYVDIRWESEYTPFWRHKIPEIVYLYVIETHRRQGIASELIKAIEMTSKKKGIRKIGVRIERTGEFAIVRDFFQTLGYREDVLGEKQTDSEIAMVKALL